MRKSRRAAGIGLAVVLAFGVMGAAVAIDNSGDRDPLTAEQVYDDSMTLEEVAAAASGKVGEIAPPCPSEELVTQLKAADIDFGPCDPFPEKGQGVVIADLPEVDEAATAENCPAVIGSKGYPNLQISLPCAAGAKILDYTPVVEKNQVCMNLTYIASSEESARTEYLCPGQKASIGGTSVGEQLAEPYTTVN